MPSEARPGFALWLTGLPASGKTSLAYALSHLFLERGIAVQILDSDELRGRLTPSPTYSADERDWFYDTVVFLAELLTANGVNVVIAATASRRAYRQAARDRIARFAEVHLACPAEVCRVRDPKGLWERADRGEIANLPGSDAPYEAPDAPEARVDTLRYPTEAVARHVLRQLDGRGFLTDVGALDSVTRVANRNRAGGVEMFKRILLATDGSPDAGQALAHARDLALRDDAEVVVVHAFEPVPSYLGDPWQDRVAARHVSTGQEVADSAAQDLQQAGISVIVEVLEGPAADAILKVAGVRGCDLIVMGSRGYGTLAGLLLGSVSHRVLAHARVPVLIVRANVENTG